MEINQSAKEQYYPSWFSGSLNSDLDDGQPQYYPLVYLNDVASDERQHCCVLKRFINIDKSIIMAQGPCSFYFIKVDPIVQKFIFF